MSQGGTHYKVLMEDSSELFFEARDAVNVDVEVHPEDRNVWRVMDAEGRLVFVGQGVRCIVRAADEAEG